PVRRLVKSKEGEDLDSQHLETGRSCVQLLELVLLLKSAFYLCSRYTFIVRLLMPFSAKLPARSIPNHLPNLNCLNEARFKQFRRSLSWIWATLLNVNSLGGRNIFIKSNSLKVSMQ